MKLIYDNDSSPAFEVEEVLDESTGKSTKKYKIKGIFSTMGEKNRNGRIYPRDLWENEITKYQENFQSGSINTLMEYEHPARTSVEPMEAVAKITELKIKDKYVMGEAVLLNNAKANHLKSLIDEGIKISVSSRGVGSVKNGIVENFKLVTYDIVASPSDYNATMNGLVESYQLNEGVIEDLSFGLDEYGNIVEMNESDCGDSCSLFAKEDIEKAITTKFSDILGSWNALSESDLTEGNENFKKAISKVLDLAEELENQLDDKALLGFRKQNMKAHNEMKKLVSNLIGVVEDSLPKN